MSPSQGLDRRNEDPPPNAGSSTLLAWDPSAQREAWRIKTPGIVNGGVAVTAGGLVFQALADGRFLAHAATDGRELWSFYMGTGTLSAPITFMVRGKQYVSVIASWAGAIGALGSLGAQFGWVGRDHPYRLLTFVLDGQGKLPTSPPPMRPLPVDDPQFEVDAAKATAGKMLFGLRCSACHGAGAVAGGHAPDLRASSVVLSGSAFASVVRDGALESRGMPKFGEFTDEQIGDLRHYIRAQARQDMKVNKELYKQP
jgi:quinohemoprotein ethanol dehydrogenase